MLFIPRTLDRRSTPCRNFTGSAVSALCACLTSKARCFRCPQSRRKDKSAICLCPLIVQYILAPLVLKSIKTDGLYGRGRQHQTKRSCCRKSGGSSVY
ncbi:hypothetical protein BCR37DRAFT_256238 [Protomyces lactucae-debilis]|uniref:Uncharacterized protein n=1 Tax=Protomyces lactucae-debilis TaxID=2754530 RepID=A0A1Y2FM10_PROLT|nr:uncharacterized protein BCR37DRAFT_256238 [Protomyces lactucae-debilis]ORY85011.1 hypothetical protein BCR37DRAFT_256238 [Protomyces lactucae-debilis]